MKNFIRYHQILVCSCLILIISIIATCYIVDPYAVYGRVYLNNGRAVNGHEFASQLRMSKVVALKKQRPAILWMGSSRVAFGFSAESAQKYFPNQTIYNLGLLGITEYELLRYFQHASYFNSVKHVIIGLDLLQFNANQPARPDFVEQRLAVNPQNQAYNTPYWGDYIPTLFSVNALVGSFKELTGLAKSQDLYYTNGFRVNEMIGAGVQHFIINESGYINGVYSNFSFQDAKKTFNTLNYFKQILELAYQKHIQLHLFISPAHARQWEALHGVGLWETWEAWKTQLVAINENVARTYHTQPFELIDFSGYSIYSTEAVPRSAGKPMHWYTDSSHFLPALGEVILQRLFQPTARIETDFGVKLSSTMLTNHFAKIRAGRVAYLASHPQDKADIDKLIEERARRIHTLFGTP